MFTGLKDKYRGWEFDTGPAAYLGDNVRGECQAEVIVRLRQALGKGNALEKYSGQNSRLHSYFGDPKIGAQLQTVSLERGELLFAGYVLSIDSS